ncbi:metallopeptidase MepB [Stipitochalara longipes BDJ]|nr:metallopeptidase MepB [Stipitochalara longipes BDJ]
MSTPQPLPRVLAAEEIVPSMQRIISRYNTVIEEIIRTVTPLTATFDTVMRPYAEVDNDVQAELGMIYMLQYAAPDMATQDAVTKAQTMLAQAGKLWYSSDKFFLLLQSARDKLEKLDPESSLYLDEMLLDYKSCGHGLLNEAQREQYLKEQAEIAQLRQKFERNLAQENDGVWFSELDLDGVPADKLARWKDGSEPTNLGKKFVPFSNGGMTDIMTYARSSETRKKMFLGNNSKLPSNGSIFEDIVMRRYLSATFLGYPNYSTLRAERRMAKTTKWIEEFLSRLQSNLVPRGRKELEVLRQRREQDLRENGSPSNQDVNRFPPWDYFYYQNLLEQEFQVNNSEISEFFPLEQTAIAMLDLFSTLLGLRFQPIPDEAIGSSLVWHETVRVFSVWDENEHSLEFLGYLYFDLLWRENKYQGNHNVNIECGYLKQNGSRHYPSTILMCAFPKPTPTSCALLKHREVVTLFHEMGHGIHNLLSKTRYAQFHGTRLPHDFGEMPSLMLENWCWMEDVLRQLSCHYTTLNREYLKEWRSQRPGVPDPPKKIPHELVNRLTKHRYFNRGLYYLYQLSTSIFDMKVHSLTTEQDAAKLNSQKLWYAIREEIEGMDFSDCEDGFQFVSFTHLVAGYDAGYYAYLCCTALAQDLFQSIFAKDPWDRDSWNRYRHEILEHGGSHEDNLKMLEAFLGRPPNLDALVEGLADADGIE